jgi:hypothetical protein
MSVDPLSPAAAIAAPTALPAPQSDERAVTESVAVSDVPKPLEAVSLLPAVAALGVAIAEPRSVSVEPPQGVSTEPLAIEATASEESDDDETGEPTLEELVELFAPLRELVEEALGLLGPPPFLAEAEAADAKAADSALPPMVAKAWTATANEYRRKSVDSSEPFRELIALAIKANVGPSIPLFVDGDEAYRSCRNLISDFAMPPMTATTPTGETRNVAATKVAATLIMDNLGGRSITAGDFRQALLLAGQIVRPGDTPKTLLGNYVVSSGGRGPSTTYKVRVS